MYRDFIPLRQIFKPEILPPHTKVYLSVECAPPPFKTILTSISFILFSPPFFFGRIDSSKLG